MYRSSFEVLYTSLSDVHFKLLLFVISFKMNFKYYNKLGMCVTNCNTYFLTFEKYKKYE